MYNCGICGETVGPRTTMMRIIKYRESGGHRSIAKEIPACERCYDMADKDEVIEKKREFKTSLREVRKLGDWEKELVDKDEPASEEEQNVV